LIFLQAPDSSGAVSIKPGIRQSGWKTFIIQGFISFSGASMPIYAYRCEECGFAKDVLQKISDEPLTVCPSCAKPGFRKQVTAAGFQLKGNGWYVTDFRGGSGGNSSANGASGTSGTSATAPAKDAGSESAAASAAPAAPAADSKAA
jgi:putative FmdB family regulatory protein